MAPIDTHDVQLMIRILTSINTSLVKISRSLDNIDKKVKKKEIE